jgi:hypothetical protein
MPVLDRLVVVLSGFYLMLLLNIELGMQNAQGVNIIK